jgi:hypothetical protein
MPESMPASPLRLKRGTCQVLSHSAFRRRSDVGTPTVTPETFFELTALPVLLPEFEVEGVFAVAVVTCASCPGPTIHAPQELAVSPQELAVGSQR